MTGFEHLQVLVSVVVGLALTNLLSGVGMALKKQQPIYFAQGLWTINLATFIVLFWWFTFTDFAGLESFHPYAYMFVLLFAFALYLPTRVLFPEHDQQVDLRSHYFANRRVFFRLMLFAVGIDLCDTYVKHGLGYAAPGADWFDGVWAPYFVWTLCQIGYHWHASRTESQRFHAGWAVLYLGFLLFWLSTMTPLSNS